MGREGSRLLPARRRFVCPTPGCGGTRQVAAFRARRYCAHPLPVLRSPSPATWPGAAQPALRSGRAGPRVSPPQPAPPAPARCPCRPAHLQVQFLQKAGEKPREPPRVHGVEQRHGPADAARKERKRSASRKPRRTTARTSARPDPTRPALPQSAVLWRAREKGRRGTAAEPPPTCHSRERCTPP